MIRASILGATGYVGLELTRLLCSHPDVSISRLVSHSQAGEAMASLYPSLTGYDLPALCALDMDDVLANSDVIFTALPHGASNQVIPQLVEKGGKVIDMSGDFRYDDPAVYSAWYGCEHAAPELLKQSVYGLPELHRSAIVGAKLIGNPGCYTTCSILALAPLAKHHLIDFDTIVIDAKSGATGAGRGASTEKIFCEVNESLKAYNVAKHRHTSEIEQELSKLAGEPIALSFTPHLLPINRGILATSYAKLAPDAPKDPAALLELYKTFYAGEPFVRIFPEGSLPEIKHVVGSNSIAIGLTVDKRLGRVIVVSCIDNLVKGAAGQAIENMNLLFGLSETAGLSALPWSL